jgi:hypothetical protein
MVMKKKGGLGIRFLLSMAGIMVVVGGCAAFTGSFYDVAPRITAETLLANLDNPDLAIVDVRLNPVIYALSGKMIKNAVHHNPNKLDSWIGQYDPEKSIALYCS